MARANAAYYATHDPFADFVTAPEISQMFGELLGAWAAHVWETMGSPERVVLAEAGPGRGTLIRDALRVADKLAPRFASAIDLCLIETSPALRQAQARVLPRARFAGDFTEVPDGPLILLANEFLDVLPIRQFVRTEAGWVERYVADGKFLDLPCDPIDRQAEPGEIVESGEAASFFVAAVSARVADSGGAGLFIDYGPTRSAPGDSLQALRGGKPTDPLSQPGTADLTAHVDFETLAGVARAVGAAVHGPKAQGSFLSRLGIYQRAQVLARGKEPAMAMNLMARANRLADPTAMGTLFKVLAVTHPALPMPAGFAP